jgi:hypothetical protein
MSEWEKHFPGPFDTYGNIRQNTPVMGFFGEASLGMMHAPNYKSTNERCLSLTIATTLSTRLVSPISMYEVKERWLKRCFQI